MKCVAYCRVSTGTDEQINSIENQQDYFTQLFKTKGHEPAPCGMLNRKGKPPEMREDGIFADEGISGTKLKNRDAFNYMIELAEQGQFDAIFVKNIFRFSRYVVDGVSTLKKLRSCGVQVFPLDTNIDASDPNHEFTVNLVLSMGQEESRAKSGAVKFGLRCYREKGGLSGNPAYGYDRKDKHFVINQEESETVKNMFDLYLNQGKGLNAIARILNDTNVKTKQSGVWRDTTVRGILTRKIYIGIIESGKNTSFDINTGETRPVPEEEWTVFHSPDLRIVDDEIFFAVQREMKKRATSQKTTGHKITDILFSSLFVCGHCGTSYIRKVRGSGEAGKRLGHYWTCRSRDKGIPVISKEDGTKESCQYRYRILEEDVLYIIQRKIEEMKKTDFAGEYEAYLDIYYRYEPEKMDTLKKKIDTINKRIDVNVELYAEDKDKEGFTRRNNQYRQELRSAEHDYNILINNKHLRDKAQKDFDEYLTTLRNIDTENLTNKDLKRLFHCIHIKQWGRPLRPQGQQRPFDPKTEKLNTTLISIEFDFNFLGVPLSEIIKRVQESELPVSEQDTLLDKMRYCNFDCIPFSKQGKTFTPFYGDVYGDADEA